MGFLDFIKEVGEEIGRGVVNAKRAVCRGVGKAIEKVGEITRLVDVEIFGWNIQMKNPVLKKKVDLNDSQTSIKDTIDVQAKCEETRAQVEVKAKKIEDTLVDGLEDKISKYIDALAEVFPEEILNEFNYELESSFEDDIHNTLSDYVAVHVSPDSDEYVRILNEPDDVREEKMKEYIQKVEEGAKRELKQKCVEKEIAIFRKMHDDLDRFFLNERKLIDEARTNLEKLKAHQNDMKFYRAEAICTIVDVSHMEAIRTLTYERC